MNAAFAGREILLGVTGSIAAYKACELASRLTEAGARVRAVLTKSACEFVGPLSFEAITGNPVITAMFGVPQDAEIEHIAVSRRAELVLVAPASANFLAKTAHGLADDWLSTALLATQATVLFAPAMNMHMYAHPATQANIQTLRERGAHFVGPEAGNLACGDVGPGRLIDTPAILAAAAHLLAPHGELSGKRVLITSGPTREAIDPVRYLSNRSSGKMGHALAAEALRRGAAVTVVSGPVEACPPAGAEVLAVESAEEMRAGVAERFPGADIFIAAAAVADYRAESPADEKHKRNGEPFHLRLTPNPDILAEMAARKRADQIVVGFAAETHRLLEHAAEKLERKHLDLLVANEVGGMNSAIGADASEVYLLRPDAPPEQVPRAGKAQVAAKIFDAIQSLHQAAPVT